MSSFDDTCTADRDRTGSSYVRLLRKGSALSPSFRWVVLVVVCIGIYAMIYCYDNPFALQNQLMDEYGLTPVQYNFLYSVYGYVNVISPLISGLLIDYIGINSSAVLFYLLIVIGQFVWVFGTHYYSYSIMVLGRAIFGTGAQPFHTCRKYYSFEYFEGQEYSFAAGMTLFASRFASATQSYFTTLIYDSTQDIVLALSVGLALVIGALFCLIAFIVYRRCAIARNQGAPIGVKEFSIPHILYRRYQRRKRNKNRDESGSLVGSSEMAKSKFNLDGLCNGAFDRRFVIISCLIMTFYPSYLSFTNVGSSFLQARYEYTYEKANFLITTPLFVAAFTIPLFGFLMDRYGQRCPWLVFSSLLLIGGLCLLGFSDIDDYKVIGGLVSFGVGMAIGSAMLWPSVALICSKQYLATALGFIGCLDNAAQATSFLIVGMLMKDEHEPDQYEYVTYWIILLAVLMLLFSLLLWYYDKTLFGNALNRMEAKFDATMSTIERDHVLMSADLSIVANERDITDTNQEGMGDAGASTDNRRKTNSNSSLLGHSLN
eukprot:583645_1